MIKLISLNIILLFFTVFQVCIPFTASANAKLTPDQNFIPCGTESYPIKPPTIIKVDVGGKLVDKDVSGTVINPCGFNDVITLIKNIANYLIILGAAVSALAFAWAGFLMMTAAGEMGKIEHAKEIFGKVLVGFLIMLSAWLIVYAIESAFIDKSSGIKSFLQAPTN